MTPNEAYHAMRDIARKHRDDAKRAISEGEKLLCEVARKTGYFRAADVFEKEILK